MKSYDYGKEFISMIGICLLAISFGLVALWVYRTIK